MTSNPTNKTDNMDEFWIFMFPLRYVIFERSIAS
jgi:hypothetical protein